MTSRLKILGHAEIITVALFFVGAVVMFIVSFSYEYSSRGYVPGPGMFPRWLSAALAVLSLIHLVRLVAKKTELSEEGYFSRGPELMNLLTIVGSIVLFILIAPFAGYIVADTLMVSLLCIKKFKWYAALGVSAAITGVLFAVFHSFLQVPLPSGPWGW